MIRLDSISKRYGSYDALKDIDLDVRDGEFLALLGPSGSGKTTLLRIVAGLAFPDRGSVLFDGEDVTGLKVAERKVGFVFQHYALFKHMTVADNVGFGLSAEYLATRVRQLFHLWQPAGNAWRFTSLTRLDVEEGKVAYDHRDAAGFIKLNALRLRVAAKRDKRAQG